MRAKIDMCAIGLFFLLVVPVSAQISTPTYCPSKIVKKGSALYTHSENQADLTADNLFLVRGVGEYYELRDYVLTATNAEQIFNLLATSKINMFRLFLYSGDVNEPSLCPFLYNTSTGLYYLDQFDYDYFILLRAVLEKANEKNVMILISFFDFSEDLIGSGYARSAWHPGNHYPVPGSPSYPAYTPTPDPEATYAPNYFDEIENLCWFYDTANTDLLNLQKGFIQTVVNETKNYPNVMYEIANEPKCGRDCPTPPPYGPTPTPGPYTARTMEWIDLVALFTKTCSYGPTPSASATPQDSRLVCCVEGLNCHYIDETIQKNEYIDILSRHDAYNGYCAQGPTPISCDDGRDFGISINSLNTEAQNLSDDSYIQVSENENIQKVRLVDTDGCSRGASFDHPRGRDYDVNIENWAAMGILYGCGINTKEMLYEAINPMQPEIDCTPAPQSITCFNGTVDYQTGWSYSDDFLWEKRAPNESPSLCKQFGGFDIGAAEALNKVWTLGVMPTQFIKSMGYGPLPCTSYEDSGIVFKAGAISGYENFSAQNFTIQMEVDYDNNWDDPTKDHWNFLQGDITSLSIPKNNDGYYYTTLPITTEHTEYIHSPYRIMAKFHSSAVAPFLTIHQSANSENPFIRFFSHGASANLYDVLEGIDPVIEFHDPKISDRQYRLWDIVESPSISNGTRPPIIVDAGYEFSNLYAIPMTGRLLLTLTIYDPSSNGLLPTVTDLQFRVLGCDWIDIPIDTSNLQYYSWVGNPPGLETGLMFGFTVQFPLNQTQLRSGEYSFEFQVGDGIHYSDIWPYLTLHPPLPTKYSINSELGQDLPNPPTGDYKTIQYVVGEVLSENTLTTQEEPIILELADGNYIATNSSKIVLRNNYHLVGSSPDKCFIKLGDQEASNGFYLVAGEGSRISNCTIFCGTEVTESQVKFENCIFKVTAVDDETVPALALDGRHHCKISNCVFDGCKKAVEVGTDSVLTMTNSTMINCLEGLEFNNNSIGRLENCILAYNPEATAVTINDTSEVEVRYSCFYGNDLNHNTGVLFDNELGNIYLEDPLLADPDRGDYHLSQPISHELSSPCINAGSPTTARADMSTARDGHEDTGSYDIGYHYPAITEFTYVIPKFKAYEPFKGKIWKSEIGIQNPNNFAVEATISYYQENGTYVDDAELEFDAHETIRLLLTPDTTPAEIGNALIVANGPLFGHCLQTYTQSTYAKSYMTQMQRVDGASDVMSSTSLCVGNWSAHWGGGNNVGNTEFVITNYHDEEVTVSVGKFFNPSGQELMNPRIYNYTLDPHETYTYSINSGNFPLNWGSLVVEATKPLVGEMIINSKNDGSNTYSSEAVIMIPESQFSNKIVAPMLQTNDYGNQHYEDYVIIKNTSSSGVSVDIDIFDGDGDAISPNPYPTPVSIAANSLYAIDVYSALGTSFWGSAEISTTGNVLIGHNEVVGYYQPTGRLQIAGAELDSVLTNNTKYFVPLSRAIDNGTIDSEESWLVIKNLSGDTNNPAEISIIAYNMAGTVVNSPVSDFELDAHEIYAIELIPTPGTSEVIKSFEINSTKPLSGWVERWSDPVGTKIWYDAILMQTW